jgi:hypothetical protein
MPTCLPVCNVFGTISGNMPRPRDGLGGLPGPTGAASTVAGPTGAASTIPGPEGPTGPISTVPGPTGPFSLGFGQFYGMTSGTGNGGPTAYAGTIAAGAPVPFPADGPATGGLARSGASTTDFILPVVGVYEVTFSLHTTEPGQLMLEVDGVALDYTVATNANPTMGGHPIGGTHLVATGADNATLRVMNPPGNATALTVTPADGTLTQANIGSLIVKRLA